jgi:gamma-glutamylputrescine oxidase
MVQDFSFWEYETYHTRWDVCIVGSGINGCSTGIDILERNPAAKVLMVDRWFIPLGASTRNAGFSCFGSPSEILDDVSSIGEDAAINLINKRWNGLKKLRNRLENSNAQYETTGGYELYHTSEYETIYPRLPYLNDLMEEAIGIKEVFNPVIIPEGIRGFSNAINNSLEGQLHPGYMMEYLKQKYLELGGTLWTGLNIERIEDDGHHILLKSKLAIPVEARHVIVTTNAFVKDLLPDLDVHGARNHVLVTEPIPNLSWKGCFHYDKGFYYFRNVGNRILLGGARNRDFNTENTDHFGSNDIIVEALEDFLYEHLADKESCKIEFRWSGIIATGRAKGPIIKSISPRLSVGVRCSGMGIALASLIGEELAEMALQQLQ